MHAHRCVFALIAASMGVVLNSWAGAADAWPVPTWTTVSAAEAGLDETQLFRARDYALTGGGAGYVTCGGRLVLSWGDVRQKFDLKSTTKSFGATALGIAVLDGKIALTDNVQKHHPDFGLPPKSNAETGWLDQITIQHLATQTAGFEKPGGYEKLTFKPGTKWNYSDGGPNWLAECITLAYQQDVDVLMFDRVFTPLGIARTDLVWRNNSYRDKQINGIMRREFGSGISANVDAMARVGLLYLRGGLWNGKRILPADFVRQAGATDPAVVGLPELDPKNYGNASDHYGLLWWNNADGTLKNVPRDAFWSWGLYDSLIVVIPSLDLVISRAGQSWKRDWAGHYDVLDPFLGPIVAATGFKPPEGDLLERRGQKSGRVIPGRPATSPYPPSVLISAVEWAPANTIVRKARGGDNWPMTWADDDNLYTAYGDGKGFEPYINEKYVVSHDNDSAYTPADRMVLARVPSGRILQRDAYQFFAGHAADGQPNWSDDIAKRDAVFIHPGRCYRSGIGLLYRCVGCRARRNIQPADKVDQ